jgi:peptidoglycan/LPS O-acetylase OafA/YrhL
VNVRARRFPLFDSLRAIAAFLVLCSHAAGPAHAADDGTFAQPFATRLGVGVAVFFVISGFLLYRPFVHARVTDRERPGFAPYALGRFLRIYPAYWVALIVTSLWIASLSFHGNWWSVYLLLHNYFGLGLTGIGAAWSLAIEVAFYVFLPFFVVAMARLPGTTTRARFRNEAVAIVLLAVIGLGTRAYLLAHDGGVSPDELPLTFLFWFALGMGLAALSVWVELRGDVLPSWLRPLDRFPSLAWAAALLFFVAVSLGYGAETRGFTGHDTLGAHVLYGLFAIALVVPVALGDQRRGRLRRALANRVLLYLGLVSYGIFLWHMAVIEQLKRWHLERIDFIHPYVLWPLVALAITTAIATVSYYVIERPAMSLRRRVFGPRAGLSRGEALAEPTPAAPLPEPR